MASGKQHAKIAKRVTLISGVTSLGLSLYSFEAFAPTWIIVLGTVQGFFVTPDLDVDKRTYEQNRVFRFSRPLGYLWFWYWLPYAKYFKHSRLRKSEFTFRDTSHWHVVGTAVRAAYLYWLLLLGLALTPYVGSVEVWILLLLFFVGWCFQDSVHIITDNLSTWNKRRSARFN